MTFEELEIAFSIPFQLFRYRNSYLSLYVLEHQWIDPE